MNVPTPDPALRQLDFLVGTWQVEGSTVPEFDGPELTSTSTETFEWLHGGFFLVHQWEAVFGDPADGPRPELPGGPIQRGYMFWGYDAAESVFRTHFFDGNGPHHEGSTYEGDVLPDGRFQFTGPARFTLTRRGDDTIINDWEIPDGERGWRPWRHTVMTRMSGRR